MEKKHVCHARCLVAPPDRVFSCKCTCGGEHHGTLFLARLPWHERQREKFRIKRIMENQIGFLDRKTQSAAFIKESQKTIDMINTILTYEPKKRLAAKRRRA
jgi:hypothetical protein